VDPRRLALTGGVALLLVAAPGCGGDGSRGAPSTVVRTTTPVPVATSTTPPASTTIPAVTGGSLQQFTPATASTWWAVVQGDAVGSVVVRTLDSGQHWQDVTPVAGSIASGTFLNADIGWVVGYVTEGASDPLPAEPLHRTLDGGRAWQQLATVPNGCALDFVDPLHGWCDVIGAAAGSESVSLTRTVDGGSTWSLVSRTGVDPEGSTPGALPFGCDKAIAFTSPAVGWAAGYCSGGPAHLYTTLDSGRTWELLPPVPVPTGAPVPEGEGLTTPVVAGAEVALAVEIGGRPGATAIDVSPDGGMTWRTQWVPGAPQSWSVDLVDPTHWRLTDGTVLLATDDAGAHWRRWTPSIALQGTLDTDSTLDFLSPLVGWAVPSVNGGTLWWTVDGGSSWTAVRIVAGPYQLPAP